MDYTLIRQWTLLRMIPRHPRRIDAPSLHRKLAAMGISVTLRTVQRDLNDLCSAFPLRSDRSKPQGWWFEKNASFEIPGMDPHAALTFNLVEQHMKNLLPPATLDHLTPWFETARGIAHSKASNVLKWQDKIRVIPHTLNMVPVKINGEIQEVIYDGLLRGQQLEITYRALNRGHEAKTYTVHPLGLVAMEQVIYLVCTIKEYSDPRFLALHRIDNASLLAQSVKIPEGFDIDEFIAREFGIRVASQPVELVLKVRGLLGKYLMETPLAGGQKTRSLDGGWTRIEVTVPDTVQLRTWIMSLGKDAVVDAPDTLREEIVEEFKQSRANYD